MSRRVVFDTSTLVSAALREGSAPWLAFHAALRGYDLCASADTLDELERVLENAKFDAYLDRASRRRFVALVRRHILLFAVSPDQIAAVDPPCRDPRDHPFLALAATAGARLIVSSDKDLLVLHPWRRIAILTPADFLSTVIA
jgi:uncharacterized protein